jgi:uncharacterized SAM-binding protein YcdF (DUF218 family)
MNRVVRAVAVLLAVSLGYLGVTAAEVLWFGARSSAPHSDAIVVLGAAQYDGRPSPVLAARLDHALALWQQGVAPIIFVTGGKQPGDRFTEASASADYLIARGVPDARILREVQGRTSWASLAAAARILKQRGLRTVVLVSDPYHALRIAGIAEELVLSAHVSPTRTSPEPHVTRHVLEETAGVALARFVGYRRLLRLDN